MRSFKNIGVTKEMQKKSKRKILVKLVDPILLAMLEKNSPSSGYDIMDWCLDKFGLHISSGTIYSHLYKLERHGLVEATPTEKKMIFSLTGKGKQELRVLITVIEEVFDFLKS